MKTLRSSFGLAILLAVGLTLGIQSAAHAQCGITQIQCPDDIDLIGCEPNGAFVTYVVPTAFNDCGPVEVTRGGGPESGGLFPFGTTVVSFAAPAEGGGFVPCSFLVHVRIPTFYVECPASIHVTTCDPEGAIVNYETPTGGNQCGPLEMTLGSGLPSGSRFPIGVTPVTWATPPDPNGGVAPCNFLVTVDYMPNRRLYCPQNIVVDGCADGAIVEYPTPTAEDDCGPLSTFLFMGLPSGSLFPPGTTPMAWATETDAMNGSAVCYWNITVMPHDPPPTIACPKEQFVVAPAGQSSATVYYENVVASDSCGESVALTFDPPDGSVLPCGTTTVIATATDGSGQQASCEFTVTVSLSVPLDIRPGSCPNPLNTSTQGVLPVAILGSSLFDSGRIDPSSVRLEGVAPTKWSREDVGAPFIPFLGKDDCEDCNSSRKDRVADLLFKFSVPDLVAALGIVSDGECRLVRLTGQTKDGCPIVGEDIMSIRRGVDLAAIDEPAATGAPTPEAIDRVVLHAAQPNPLRHATGIRYDLPVAARARLGIYDVAGRLVRTIVDEDHAAGHFERTWDGNDVAGLPVTGGVYFSVLVVDGARRERQVTKLIVSR